MKKIFTRDTPFPKNGTPAETRHWILDQLSWHFNGHGYVPSSKSDMKEKDTTKDITIKGHKGQVASAITTAKDTLFGIATSAKDTLNGPTIKNYKEQATSAIATAKDTLNGPAIKNYKEQAASVITTAKDTTIKNYQKYTNMSRSFIGSSVMPAIRSFCKFQIDYLASVGPNLLHKYKKFVVNSEKISLKELDKARLKVVVAGSRRYSEVTEFESVVKSCCNANYTWFEQRYNRTGRLTRIFGSRENYVQITLDSFRVFSHGPKKQKLYTLIRLFMRNLLAYHNSDVTKLTKADIKLVLKIHRKFFSFAQYETLFTIKFSFLTVTDRTKYMSKKHIVSFELFTEAEKEAIELLLVPGPSIHIPKPWVKKVGEDITNKNSYLSTGLSKYFTRSSLKGQHHFKYFPAGLSAFNYTQSVGYRFFDLKAFFGMFPVKIFNDLHFHSSLSGLYNSSYIKVFHVAFSDLFNKYSYRLCPKAVVIEEGGVNSLDYKKAPAHLQELRNSVEASAFQLKEARKNPSLPKGCPQIKKALAIYHKDLQAYYSNLITNFFQYPTDILAGQVRVIKGVVMPLVDKVPSIKEQVDILKDLIEKSEIFLGKDYVGPHKKLAIKPLSESDLEEVVTVWNKNSLALVLNSSPVYKRLKKNIADGWKKRVTFYKILKEITLFTHLFGLSQVFYLSSQVDSRGRLYQFSNRISLTWDKVLRYLIFFASEDNVLPEKVRLSLLKNNPFGRLWVNFSRKNKTSSVFKKLGTDENNDKKEATWVTRRDAWIYQPFARVDVVCDSIKTSCATFKFQLCEKFTQSGFLDSIEKAYLRTHLILSSQKCPEYVKYSRFPNMQFRLTTEERQKEDSLGTLLTTVPFIRKIPELAVQFNVLIDRPRREDGFYFQYFFGFRPAKVEKDLQSSVNFEAYRQSFTKSVVDLRYWCQDHLVILISGLAPNIDFFFNDKVKVQSFTKGDPEVADFGPPLMVQALPAGVAYDDALVKMRVSAKRAFEFMSAAFFSFYHKDKGLLVGFDASSSVLQLLGVLAGDPFICRITNVLNTADLCDLNAFKEGKICSSILNSLDSSIDPYLALVADGLNRDNLVEGIGIIPPTLTRSAIKLIILRHLYGGRKLEIIRQLCEDEGYTYDEANEFYCFVIETTANRLSPIFFILDAIKSHCRKRVKAGLFFRLNLYPFIEVEYDYRKEEDYRFNIDRSLFFLPTQYHRVKLPGDAVDMRKSLQALIPNICQSLDSFLIYAVTNAFLYENRPVFCIHDCFHTYSKNFSLLLDSYNFGLLLLYKERDTLIEGLKLSEVIKEYNRQNKNPLAKLEKMGNREFKLRVRESRYSVSFLPSGLKLFGPLG